MADENDLSKAPDEYDPGLDKSLVDVDGNADEESIPLDRSLEAPSPGEDIDPETYGLFWRLVLVFDVALFALAVGPMFIYFEGDWLRGGALFALGVIAFAYGVSRYRAYRESD